MTEENPQHSSRVSEPKLDQIVRQTIDSSEISKYGTIIYSHNESVPNRLYVISQIHDIEINGTITFSSEVPRVQAEIYRLASHIIESGEVNLLLPEGRYLQKDYTEENAKLRGPEFAWLKVPNTATDKGLERNLKILLEHDIHSDKLLIISHPNLDAQGAEDQEVGELLPEITQMAEKGVLSERLFRHLIAYKSGYFLHVTPKVIEREFNKGRISSRNAIVTMGHGHMGEVIDYLKRGQIDLPPLTMGDRTYPGLRVRLNLGELGYGVTIIKPLGIR